MLLRIEDLHTQFSTEEGTVRAVDGVSLTIDAGEVVGLVGESGSGKSVTSMSILRLIPDPPGKIVKGRILWDDGQGAPVDLARASEEQMTQIRGDRIAMIFQDPMTSLNPYLTVGEQLTEVLETHRNQKRKAAREAAVKMLGAVGIPMPEARFEDYPHQLSGGMRQRVMIAMALLCDPALLIADEPTTALDVTIQAQILDLLSERRARRARGGGESTAILLITHDLGVIAKMADRVLVMYAGKVVEQASTEALFARPGHPYTIGLLRSIPRLGGPKQARLSPIAGMPPSLAHVPSGCAFHPRCPFAMEVCSKEAPPERVISGSREGDVKALHVVRCHLEESPPVGADGASGGVS
ncbi:MAG: ABC transporter ATP-binding protein [Polyangiaceae bacterium]